MDGRRKKKEVAEKAVELLETLGLKDRVENKPGVCQAENNSV